MDNPIHNKTWDVTNGKLRFYEPTNLGIEVANNLWGSSGIGVLGTRSINQPQMEFKLETFGTTLQENYTLMNGFVNDLLSVKYVTLEYQTEWFQVYADIALNEVTKTEGYGQNGTFSEKIVFDIVTKWYTFENLEFKTIANGEIIDGISKIYGGKYDASPKNYYPYTSLMNGFGGWTPYPSASDWEVLQPEGGVGAGIMHAKGSTATNQQCYYKPHNTPVAVGETWTVSFDYRDINWTKNTTIAQVRITSTADDNGTIEFFQLSATDATTNWTRKTLTFTVTKAGFLSFNFYDNDNTGNHEGFFRRLKVEKGSKASNWSPDDVGTAGYRYIENQAYTYYGETHIERLARWDIKEPFFSFIAKLTPSPEVTAPNQDYGLQFLDVNGNEYSAIVFNFENRPDLITINTDVNDEWYQATTGDTVINAFPALSFSRYRTRIFQEGQMTMKNLSTVEIKVKRKVDFV